MKISMLKTIEGNTVQQVNDLLHLLSPSAPEVEEKRLAQLIQDADFTLFVAKDDAEKIVGMLTLTCCHTLPGRKYWVEDVIVDESCRGLGMGRALVRAAVTYVREKEMSPVIYLTSNPSRVSARNLYRSEGFEEYKTGVFRIR